MTRATLIALLIVVALPSVAVDGMVSKKSSHSVQASLDKLEAMVKKKGFTVFARIDHAKGASKVGKSLRPTQVLIFGNPKVGTALMSSQQSAGLDLPIRVLAWEDASGQVWIGYNEPSWLTERHAIDDRAKVVSNMTAALKKLTDAAAN